MPHVYFGVFLGELFFNVYNLFELPVILSVMPPIARGPRKV